MKESCWSKSLSSCSLWGLRGQIFPLFPLSLYSTSNADHGPLKPPVSSQEPATPRIRELRLPAVCQLFGAHSGHTRRWWQAGTAPFPPLPLPPALTSAAFPLQICHHHLPAAHGQQARLPHLERAADPLRRLQTARRDHPGRSRKRGADRGTRPARPGAAGDTREF